jgi:LysR family transcriptional regulator, carnitine catabolism transcriptional activator
MGITLLQLKAFLAVARFGSFTAAAQALHISQPALTVQVQQLEGSLGLRLFDRDTRHVELTPSGSLFAPKFRRLLLDLEVVIDNARNFSELKHGVIRFGSIPSVAATYLPEVMSGFRVRYPQVSYDLHDADGQGVVEMVRSDGVEFGITNLNQEWSDLDRTELYKEDIHVVCPKSHVVASLKSVTLEDIISYPLVFLNTGFYSRTVLDAALAATGRFLKPACEVSYTSTAIGLVRAGLGLTILGSLAVGASNLRSFPEIISRRIVDPNLALPITLIRKTGHSLSPSAHVFVNTLIKTNKKSSWDRMAANSCMAVPQSPDPTVSQDREHFAFGPKSKQGASTAQSGVDLRA